MRKKVNRVEQWRSQEFRSGGARLKDKIGSKKLILKKLININNKISNNKISKQQYAASFVMLYSNQLGNSLNHTGLNRHFVLPN